MDDGARIDELEEQRWAAQLGGDTTALGPLLADELSYTHSNGLVDSKASYLAAIEEKVFDYRRADRTDVATTVIGDTAMVTGRVAMEVVSRGRTVELDSRFSAIWVRRGDRWQFLCWQSTPIPTGT